MGFTIAEGPEIETDYYNFEALNLPKDPLPVTCRIRCISLRKFCCGPTPLRFRSGPWKNYGPTRFGSSPGRVYRRDALDVSHSPMFHQVEGLLVDEGITFGDLKGGINGFAKKLFGEDRQVRFRPSFSRSPNPARRWTYRRLFRKRMPDLQGRRVAGNFGFGIGQPYGASNVEI